MYSIHTGSTVHTPIWKVTRILLMFVAGTFFNAGTALAVPVQAHYIDSTNCDSHGEQFPSHELGDAVSSFPLAELIQVSVQSGPIVCVPDDGAPDDFLVTITNMGSVAYTDLFFVVDSGSTVGNFDGFIEDLMGPPGVFEQAFRIDGTVTLGLNDNLIFESMGINEIFEPGETWRFLVTNFITPASLLPAPVFGSARPFAATSTSLTRTASSGASPASKTGPTKSHWAGWWASPGPRWTLLRLCATPSTPSKLVCPIDPARDRLSTWN